MQTVCVTLNLKRENSFLAKKFEKVKGKTLRAQKVRPTVPLAWPEQEHS